MQSRTLVSWLTLVSLFMSARASALDFFSAGPGVGPPDGMSDVWQAKMNAWGLNPNGDEDNDGCSNLVESVAGTDPRNAADCTRVGNITVAGNTLVFHFDAEAGKRYRVVSDDNPTGAFSTVVPLTAPVSANEYIPTADNPSATVSVTQAAGNRKFYKLETNDVDSDGDGASDWEERQTGTNPNLGNSPSNASGGAANDGDTLRSLLSLTATPQVANGYERNDKTATTPVAVPAVVRLTRSFGTMPLNGLTINSSGGASTGNQSNASAGDYTHGTTVNIPNGASMRDVPITPVQDATTEVPEYLKVSFTLPTVNSPGPSATVCICDANPALAANNQLYVAFLGHEAGQATTASGYATALVNGDNTSASVSVVFNNLSSQQNTAYIRYGQNNDLAPALPNGQVSGFAYNVVYKPGFLSSDQAFIDALRNSQIWCAITSANFPDREIAGPFQIANGSETFVPPVDEPDPGNGAWTTTTNDQIERDIWRFMGQATFGGTTSLYDEIRAKVDAQIGALGGSPSNAQITEAYLLGLEDWMDDQINSTATPSINFRTLVMAADNEEFALRGNKPSTFSGDPQINNATYQISYDAQGMPFVPPGTAANNNNFGGNYPQSAPNRRREWWTMVLQCQDQLRQRMALALSEIVVISEADQTILDRHYGCANYWDMMAAGAFGKYRTLLEQVTHSPMMGIYLSHMANRARYDANNGTPPALWVSPDENYAREIMQLFSIGLVLRHPDGSLMLDSAGLPIPTYDNNDITELARVMTGFSHGARNANGYYSSFSGTTLLYNNYSATDISDQVIQNYGANITAANFSSGNNVWFGRRDGHLFWAAPWTTPMKVIGRISDAGATSTGSIYYHDFTTYVDPVTELPVSGVSKRLLAGKHGQYDIPVRSLPALGRGANDITCHTLAAQDLTEAHNALAGNASASTYPPAPSGPGPDAGFQTNPGHTNTPINISRWLIQRLVTSNPSNGYVYRVQQSYRDTNGNLGAVLKAILLDYEARSLQLADTSISFGKVKEPLVAFAQMLRAFRAFSGAPVSILKDNAPPFGSGETPLPDAYPLTEYNKFSAQNNNPPALPNGWSTGPFRYRFGDLTGNIGQSPQRAPSVFNWFLPDFVVPGPMARAGLFAPELQINTEASVVAKVNMFYNFTWSNLTGMTTQPGADSNVADFTLSNAWATPAVLFSLDGGKTFVNSLTFNASNWNTAQTITVIAADTASMASLDNSLLRFSVTGAGSGYDALPVLPVNMTMTDNELRNEGIRVEQSGFSTWVLEGGATDTVNVRLTSAPPSGATVSVNLATSNSQATVSPTTLNFTSVNWNTAQVATITADNDSTTEVSGAANSALNITSTSSIAAWNGLSAPSVPINIVDNNDGGSSYGIVITESGGNTVVAETGNTSGAGTDSFDIVLTKQPTASVTVTVLPAFGQLAVNTTHGGTSFLTTAVTRTFTTGNWNVPQTVVVRGNEDNTAENDWPENPLHYGSLVIYGTGGSYDAVQAQTVVVPVSETAFTVSTTSDNRIMISHGGSDASETRVSEDGSITDTISVALRLAPPVGVPVTVTLGSGQLSCTPDHIVFTNSNYSTPVNVTVKATDDHLPEGLQVSERQGWVDAGAVQAFATSSITSGAVTGTTITGRGKGYSSVPQVTFAPSPTGVFATGTAVLNALGQVTSITVTSGGSGYVSAPIVTIAAPPNAMPVMPTAISTIASNAVNNVIVTSGGGGYAYPPLVFFSGAPAGGTTATGYAQINAQGQLTNIVVTNAGAGYLTAPTISFYEPPHGQATIVATATSDNVADLANYNNYWARTHSSLYCTVIDNDLASLVINQSGGNTTVNENGATDTIGFSLSQQPSATVTVTLTPTNQVLVSNTTLPTTLTFNSSNWSTEQWVTVAAVNDATVEGDLGANIGIGITSSDTTYGGLKARSVPVTVIDNDYQPLTLAHVNTWTIVAEGGAVGNSDASVVRASDTFTVSLPRAPAANTSVTVTLLPDANVTLSQCAYLYCRQCRTDRHRHRRG
jgi:uncharacterized protein (DUF1800 family)